MLLKGWEPGKRRFSNFTNASNLHCYVCDETNSKDFGCSDPSLLGSTESCSNVFDAQYCIKAEGVWAGWVEKFLNILLFNMLI